MADIGVLGPARRSDPLDRLVQRQAEECEDGGYRSTSVHPVFYHHDHSHRGGPHGDAGYDNIIDVLNFKYWTVLYGAVQSHYL